MAREEKTFTLVELLVVMGIIMILAGMLLPALGKAKAKAHTLTCVGQARQMGFARLMYAQEYDHILPIGWGAQNYHWYRRWYSYLPDVNVWQCPAYGATQERLLSAPGAGARLMAKVEYATICSGAVKDAGALGGADGPNPDCHYIKLSDVRKTSRRCLLACFFSPIRICPLEHATTQATPNYADVATALKAPKFPRHPGVMPCGFLDGHVKSLSITSGSLRRHESTFMWMKR